MAPLIVLAGMIVLLTLLIGVCFALQSASGAGKAGSSGSSTRTATQNSKQHGWRESRSGDSREVTEATENGSQEAKSTAPQPDEENATVQND